MTDTRRDTDVALGVYLREAREARGLSLEDLSRITRVGIRYLVALEEDAFERLPADVYVRGYLRAFAREVGVDPEEALSRLDATRGTPSQAPVLRLANVSAASSRGSAPRLLRATEPQSPASPPRLPPGPGRHSAAGAGPQRGLSLALAIVLLLVAAVTIAVVYYVNRPSDRGDSPRGPTTTETATFDVTG